MREGLSYDDVMLVPQQGKLEKREHADISTKIGKFTLQVPILSANMPSVTGPDLARAISAEGGLGVLHRFNSPEEAVRDLLDCSGYKKAVSVGLKGGLPRSRMLQAAGATHFFLDVAHGDHDQVYAFIREFHMMMRGSEYYLFAGNVATKQAALSLISNGVSGIKVGIGPGAACITREVTGFGVPQWTAVQDVAEAIDDRGLRGEVVLIADGGIKNSGDVVKALAAGADAVMVGRLLAGCDEAPTPGVYYGSASAHVNSHNAPEGVYGHIERTGSVRDVMKNLAWGIRSGVSYGGATNLEELREYPEWIRVSSYTAAESGIRL